MFLNFFNAPVDEISPSEALKQVKNKNTLLLDVRTKLEYNDPNYGHIDGSILIPLQNLSSEADMLTKHKDKEIIVYCKTGGRSAAACRILNKLNFKTKNMSGGIVEWNRLGY